MRNRHFRGRRFGGSGRRVLGILIGGRPNAQKSYGNSRIREFLHAPLSYERAKTTI
jgi:hypothetical protein